MGQWGHGLLVLWQSASWRRIGFHFQQHMLPGGKAVQIRCMGSWKVSSNGIVTWSLVVPLPYLDISFKKTWSYGLVVEADGYLVPPLVVMQIAGVRLSSLVSATTMETTVASLPMRMNVGWWSSCRITWITWYLVPCAWCSFSKPSITPSISCVSPSLDSHSSPGKASWTLASIRIRLASVASEGIAFFVWFGSACRLRLAESSAVGANACKPPVVFSGRMALTTGFSSEHAVANVRWPFCSSCVVITLCMVSASSTGFLPAVVGLTAVALAEALGASAAGSASVGSTTSELLRHLGDWQGGAMDNRGWHWHRGLAMGGQGPRRHSHSRLVCFGCDLCTFGTAELCTRMVGSQQRLGTPGWNDSTGTCLVWWPENLMLHHAWQEIDLLSSQTELVKPFGQGLKWNTSVVANHIRGSLHEWNKFPMGEDDESLGKPLAKSCIPRPIEPKPETFPWTANVTLKGDVFGICRGCVKASVSPWTDLPLEGLGPRSDCNTVFRDRGTSWHSHVSANGSKIVFLWEAQCFRVVLKRWVAFFVPGTGLWRLPSSFCMALYTPHSALHTSHFKIYNLHFTLHILHFTLYTPHSTLYTPHSTTYNLHSTLYTLHSTLNTLHSTLFTLHSTLYTPHSTLHTLHSTLYPPHCALHTPHFTLYTPQFTLHTLHYTPHSTLYTPHFTLHTPHFTLHTPHSTLYTPHATL